MLDRARILSFLRSNPALLTAVIAAALEETRKDPTLLPDLIDLVAGTKTYQDVLKAHPNAALNILRSVLGSLDAEILGAIFLAVL